MQGVGFRPFVYRLANEMRLSGWVLNSSQGVFIEVEGEQPDLDRFLVHLNSDKPPRSYVQGMETTVLDPCGYSGFEIRESDDAGEKSVFVLPDIATCPDCLKEISDPKDRRYRYPFTNCTNCGPRFSIIRSLPYDRSNTTMSKFQMCDDCRREFQDPSDRRFHAQPNACPKCGPHLDLRDNAGEIVASYHDALLGAARAVRRGEVLALKGIGGYQLIADAGNDEAVRILRARKNREEKPFALMFPDIETLNRYCDISELEESLVKSPEAPIVLLRRKKRSGSSIPSSDELISELVAPRNPYLGGMLPYSPVHHILMQELGFPVVATSGNISEEPICTDDTEAFAKLSRIADLFLVHDRPIERHVDDSVARIVGGRVQLVRRARGFAPFPLDVQKETKISVLAVGGHLKNTIALNSGKNVFVSQHIGDLTTKEATSAFHKVISDFENLFEKLPAVIVHDNHPDYFSTRYAIDQSQRNIGVQHHLAHIAGCMAENRIVGNVLGVSWDGTGYGDDRTVWGGEFFLTNGKDYRRIGTFKSFRLPGGDTAVKEPRRSALGVLNEIYGPSLSEMHSLSPVMSFSANELGILLKMLSSGLNSPITSSVGRLFDAASSILGLRQRVSFEGQGAMELEFACDGVSSDESYPLSVEQRSSDATSNGLLVIDWREMVKAIISDLDANVPVRLISVKFHNSLVNAIIEIAKRVGENKVIMSGGCFQNKYLTERAIVTLAQEGFSPYWNQRIPPNDGGISFGQIAYAMEILTDDTGGIMEPPHGDNAESTIERQTESSGVAETK